MKRQWKKDIHDRLQNFPRKAPEGLLNDICSEMLRRGLSPVPMPRKNRYIFLRIAASAAVLLILLGISLFWKQQPIVHPEEALFVPTAEETNLPIFAEEKEPEMPLALPSTPRRIAKVQQPSASHPDTLTTERDDAPSDRKEEEPQVEQPKETYEPQPAPAKKKQEKFFTPSRRKTSPFAFGAYYSGLVAHADISPTKNVNLTTGDSPNLNGDNSSDSTAVSSRALSRSSNNNGVKHHLPVRVGISFRYYLDEHWSIQSGLTYSYLATDITRINYRKKQTLHYIGIPIQIGYQIWGNNRFRSYLSAGGQVEKQVGGKATTNYSVNGKYPNTSTEDIHDNRLLFSALASVGLEYTLGKNFSLYAEPGVHYYFKNGNGLETHYNEQPLNFHITMGFRFHWNR